MDALASGKTTVCFGTHAILEDDVTFANLTLVIVDEQHRFGVEQRRALHAKGSAPDVLAMSATPIPRTLALVAYGDLASSYLRTRPVAGAGVSTGLLKHSQAHKAWRDVRAAVAEGRQAYVVCALVDESEKIEAESALRTAERLRAGEFADLRVEVLTGRMKPADKEAVMEAFRAGAIDVLVSTTVIEVGVDVAGATVMVILDADRYGLAQLHQLRGRVGRGSVAGQVWLVSDSFSRDAQERFRALLSTDDGFQLAELDLKQRNAGDLLGKRQSGLAEFRIADLSRDGQLAEVARSEAFALIAANPRLDADLRLALLRVRIEALEARLGDWESGG
jgi:ATP-dependent DNA helicase RecG